MWELEVKAWNFGRVYDGDGAIIQIQRNGGGGGILVGEKSLNGFWKTRYGIRVM